MKEFKISSHSTSEIMAGEVGLTELQESRLNELMLRRDGVGKPLTDNMNQELDKLIYKRDNPELPQGAKTYVKKWLKRFLFNRKEDWKSIIIDKGLHCEQEGIELVSKVSGIEYSKNEEYFSNDFIQGQPDIINEEIVRDIKSSWDLFTFPMFDDELPKKEYWWQLQSYMVMTGIKKASLDYVLINTPKPLIDLDLKKLYFQSGGDAEQWNPDAYEEMYPNYRFDDIPEEKRVRSFSFNYEEGIDKKIQERVELCRAYLQSIIEK